MLLHRLRSASSGNVADNDSAILTFASHSSIAFKHRVKSG
eukprot:CAMPEP_0204382184 /NCGR_PEP_ID=MMETSP0469-20131031/54890_1 /ASSEMBLY_ACC=CAM_ASM_000384 /TAXON_ID=2969 /ORGANISM="Oxyrrhis marina" /LENGTH=39 /DNA_ID= /DNA_START= /DNA_END= /DNA_ORIENTATION=